MATKERDTVVGVFVDRTHAEYAVEALHRQGFGAEQIGFLVLDGTDKVEAPGVDTGNRALAGAVAGAGAGVTLGTILGATLVSVALPGVGVAALVGGLLAGGMASGGLLGALIGMNIPEDEARQYEREFHSGRTLVTVQAGARYEEAAAILRQAAEKQEPRVIRHGSGTGEDRPSGGGAFVPAP